MDNKELNNKIKELKTEDFIWIIYLGIIALSFYTNGLEEKYFLYNDNKSKEKYHNLMILIFSILLIVYIYFFISSVNSLNNLKESDSSNKKKLTELSCIASLLILISGILYLYIAYKDNDIEVEIAFN